VWKALQYKYTQLAVQKNTPMIGVEHKNNGCLMYG
jgi:hypothetical protein